MFHDSLCNLIYKTMQRRFLRFYLPRCTPRGGGSRWRKQSRNSPFFDCRAISQRRGRGRRRRRGRGGRERAKTAARNQSSNNIITYYLAPKHSPRSPFWDHPLIPTRKATGRFFTLSRDFLHRPCKKSPILVKKCN